MTQSVCGELSIACIPMPGFNDTNVCSYAQPPCPFKTGVKETVTVPLPVSKSFPAVSVWVRVPPSMLLWSGTSLGEFWKLPKSDLICQFSSTQCELSMP